MLSENIVALRKARGLTQSKFAEAIHVTQSAVSQWETGRTSPDVQQTFILADFFGVTVEALTDGQYRSNGSGKADEKKEPAILSELQEQNAELLTHLSPQEAQRVLDFVAGLIAARSVTDSPQG